MLNQKMMLGAALLAVLSGCGKGDFNGRYQGYETQTGSAATMYYGANQASMDLRQDGDLVTGTYTAQRMQSYYGGAQSVTYQLNARAEKSDTLEGVQLFQSNSGQGGQYNPWGQWGGGSSMYCQLLTGTLSAPDSGKQISGSLAPVNTQQASGCTFNVSLTKMQ